MKMKTPREILMERHLKMDGKLDEIRENVVADVLSEMPRASVPNRELLPLRAVLNLWRELILPARRIWVGFACAWILIAVVNLTSSADSAGLQAKRGSPPINFALAWQQQQKFLAELNNPETADARNSKHSVPKPRSAVRFLFPLA